MLSNANTDYIKSFLTLYLQEKNTRFTDVQKELAKLVKNQKTNLEVIQENIIQQDMEVDDKTNYMIDSMRKMIIKKIRAYAKDNFGKELPPNITIIDNAINELVKVQEGLDKQELKKHFMKDYCNAIVIIFGGTPPDENETDEEKKIRKTPFERVLNTSYISILRKVTKIAEYRNKHIKLIEDYAEGMIRAIVRFDDRLRDDLDEKQQEGASVLAIGNHLYRRINTPLSTILQSNKTRKKNQAKGTLYDICVILGIFDRLDLPGTLSDFATLIAMSRENLIHKSGLEINVLIRYLTQGQDVTFIEKEYLIVKYLTERDAARKTAVVIDGTLPVGIEPGTEDTERQQIRLNEKERLIKEIRRRDSSRNIIQLQKMSVPQLWGELDNDTSPYIKLLNTDRNELIEYISSHSDRPIEVFRKMNDKDLRRLYMALKLSRNTSKPLSMFSKFTYNVLRSMYNSLVNKDDKLWESFGREEMIRYISDNSEVNSETLQGYNTQEIVSLFRKTQESKISRQLRKTITKHKRLINELSDEISNLYINTNTNLFNGQRHSLGQQISYSPNINFIALLLIGDITLVGTNLNVQYKTETFIFACSVVDETGRIRRLNQQDVEQLKEKIEDIKLNDDAKAQKVGRRLVDEVSLRRVRYLIGKMIDEVSIFASPEEFARVIVEGFGVNGQTNDVLATYASQVICQLKRPGSPLYNMVELNNPSAYNPILVNNAEEVKDVDAVNIQERKIKHNLLLYLYNPKFISLFSLKPDVIPPIYVEKAVYVEKNPGIWNRVITKLYDLQGIRVQANIGKLDTVAIESNIERRNLEKPKPPPVVVRVKREEEKRPPPPVVVAIVKEEKEVVDEPPPLIPDSDDESESDVIVPVPKKRKKDNVRVELDNDDNGIRVNISAGEEEEEDSGGVANMSDVESEEENGGAANMSDSESESEKVSMSFKEDEKESSESVPESVASTSSTKSTGSVASNTSVASTASTTSSASNDSSSSPDKPKKTCNSCQKEIEPGHKNLRSVQLNDSKVAFLNFCDTECFEKFKFGDEEE